MPQARTFQIGAALTLSVAAHAQRPVTVAVRQLGATTATSVVTFNQVQHLRALSDGRVLINDPGRHQVVLLDANLANPKVVIDSAGGTTMYGLNSGALIPFAADSTLFVDRTTSAFLVLDSKGEVARVMSMPAGNSAISNYLTNPTSFGYPAFSPALGIVYRLPMPRPQFERPRQGEPEIARSYEDSAVVMTMNVKRRTVDTLSRLGTGTTVSLRLTSNGTNSNSRSPIFPIFDDWTVMSDGTIAVLRGREYRVDFYSTDGTRTPGPRLSYPWKPVDEEARTQLVDSINTQRRKQFDDMIEEMRKQALDPNQKIGPGGEKIILVDNMPIRTYGGERVPPPTPPAVVLPNEIPDYLPAVERVTNAYRADEDDRLWIRPKPPLGSPRNQATIYDVVDRTGTLVDRVQLPVGRTLVGFAPGGIVFLTVRDGNTVKIEKHSFK